MTDESPDPVVLIDRMTVEYDICGISVNAKGLILHCSKPDRWGDGEPFDKPIKWHELDNARAEFGNRLKEWTRDHVFTGVK